MTPRERPIPFSAPMMRATLADRKRMTRRIAALDDAGRVRLRGKSWHVDDPEAVLACPYGLVGDRLWTREAWLASPAFDALPPRDLPRDATIYYLADGKPPPHLQSARYRQARFMMRRMSRASLEITATRLERLHAITENDAVDEGLYVWQRDGDATKHYGIDLPDVWETDPRKTFERLWISINGAESWDENPLVWVVSFKRSRDA